MNHIDFESRKIALIGMSSYCKHFYMQFRSVLHIQYYFATTINKASAYVEKFFAADESVEYMPWTESLIRKENLLLVLCVSHDFRKRYDQMLFNLGFIWGEDYIDSLYVVQYYREKYNLQLEEKGIWIFGAGFRGNEFYNVYKDIYPIHGFISNFEEETECQGLPVIRPSELVKQNNCYMVICSGAEAKMVEKLNEMGYCGGRDFTFAEMLPKKLFIAIGTCQIQRVAKLLCNHHQFACYDITIYRDTMYVPCNDADNRRMKEYGVFCDIVFYNIKNSGTMEQRNYEPLLKKYFPKAKRLYMPFYYFRGQLIQATESENDYTVMLHRQYFWLRGDKEVNGMMEEGYTSEEILAEISKSDYWTKEEIQNHFAHELRKIEIWDRFSSFPIKSYIEKNYRSKVVFSDGTHFSYGLCLYLADEVAKYLGLKPIDNPEVIAKLEKEEKRVMPVYPCVKDALGMDLEDSYVFYNGQTEENEEILNFQGYMRKYIQYITRVRDICNHFGTIF